jgi:myo-inositol 2-dehydrogenase/D-chiro-inositol 1-dehydrogenase
MERYVESYRVELEAFVDAVLHDEPVPVGGYDGRVAVAMGIAAQKSYKENRPVKLEEVEEDIAYEQ